MCERFSYLYLVYLRLCFRFKVMMFESWFTMYERIYGFMKVSMDSKDGSLVEELTGAANSDHPNRQ